MNLSEIVRLAARVRSARSSAEIADILREAGDVPDAGAAGLLASAVRAGLTGDDGDFLTALERLTIDRVEVLELKAASLEADGRLVDNLREVGLRLTALLDLDLLVQNATDAATTATGAQFGAFFYSLVDEYGESFTLYTLSGVSRKAFERFPMPRNTEVFAPTFNGEGTVRSDDITADPRFGRNEPHYGMPRGHLPVRSYLAVSVISPTSQEVLGGFFFGHPAAGKFTEAHERIAEGIAGYAAIGLDNARLYERERSVATDLQRRLLPAVTTAPGFTVVARYLPAATGSEVGGDWLDVIELPGGRTAFVIGDVMGRGIPAASMMGQIRTAVRAYALLDLPPGEVLRQASSLAAEMAGRQFITCVYAVHDPVEATLTYANAGHPAPALIAPGGAVSFLPERLGMPLRVGTMFEERVIDFPTGSAVVLFTDGLVERRGRTLPQGTEQLRRGLLAMDGDPARACDAIIEELTGGTHDDDVALLYAREDGVPRKVVSMPLSMDPMIAAQGRRFAAGALADWGLADPGDVVAMVVTELISNAVRHSGTPVALRLHQTDGRLIVEVADGDARQPRRFKAAVQDENHRGLFIVDTLSRRWGSRATASGKIVWAELPLPRRSSR